MSVEPIIAEPTVTPAAPEAPAAPAATAAPVAPARFQDSLPVEFKDDASLADFKNVDGLAKSYINLNKTLGGDKVSLLTENSTQEERDAFHNKLGRPESVEGYDLSAVQVPEGLPLDEALQAGMVEKMHAAGLSQTQVSAILDAYYEGVGGQFQAAGVEAQQSRAEAEKSLRDEWGRSYDANVSLANRAMVAGANGDESILTLKMQDGSDLGSHPDVVKMFATLGNQMSEHGLVGQGSPRTTQTPQEASSERNKLLADSEFLAKWRDPNNPQHDWAVKKILELTTAELGGTG